VVKQESSDEPGDEDEAEAVSVEQPSELQANATRSTAEGRTQGNRVRGAEREEEMGVEGKDALLLDCYGARQDRAEQCRTGM
jgi:hypothetical protein